MMPLENIHEGQKSRIILSSVHNPSNDISEEAQEFEIEINKPIGSGSFGIVHKGIKTRNPDKMETDVAIKTMRNENDSNQYKMLMYEINILSKLKYHLNIVNIAGACTNNLRTKENIWLVLEYCIHGDLKHFLVRNKNNFRDIKCIHQDCDCTESSPAINIRIFLEWCHQIAKGMQYLARHHIMHGDLAARNILLYESYHNSERHLIAKVGDFGLATTFYDNVCYKKQVRTDIPYKWMALEFINFGYFTLASDVWSYGVLTWEIFAFGEEPYSGIMFDEMVLGLKRGYRLPCPDKIQQISDWQFSGFYSKLSRMCFDKNPMERGTFSEIIDMIELELTQDEFDRYHEISILEAKRYTSNHTM